MSLRCLSIFVANETLSQYVNRPIPNSVQLKYASNSIWIKYNNESDFWELCDITTQWATNFEKLLFPTMLKYVGFNNILIKWQILTKA